MTTSNSMKIGIGLPAALPGVSASEIVEWAQKADEGPFSSVAVIDRIVFPCYEPMITLAAVASVTQRVGLATTLVLASLRNAGVLAKEAATLDAFSGGRLSLGLGIGRRQDDFRAAPAPYQGRGRRFEQQLDLMRKVWSGEALSDDTGPVGPAPARAGGPEVLIGGRDRRAISRVGRWADGFLAAPANPQELMDQYAIAENSWSEAGREGRPRLVGLVYYALGQGTADEGANYLRHYYSQMGPAAEFIAQGILGTPEKVKDAMRDYGSAGMDELMILPTVRGMDQLDRLADLVG